MLLPCVFGFGDYGLRLMLLPLLLWLMLLPIFIMADVISMWQVLGH